MELNIAIRLIFYGIGVVAYCAWGYAMAKTPHGLARSLAVLSFIWAINCAFWFTMLMYSEWCGCAPTFFPEAATVNVILVGGAPLLLLARFPNGKPAE